MTTTTFDVTHNTSFYRKLGPLSEADVRYLRSYVRYLLSRRDSMPTRYYVRNGVVKYIPEARAEMLRTLAATF